MVTILFESDDVIAVNKPEGLASTPEGIAGQECLLSVLASFFPEKLYVVHRLDKEVSGVILFARNAAAYGELREQFRTRQVRKTYLALVHGMVTAGGVIDRPIREFGSGRMGVDPGRGRPCRTEFQVSAHLGAYTLVEVHPITGRRHQVRVHFYSIGHPIVGDRRYGDQERQRLFPRLMLHAWTITFRRPTGEAVTVTAPIPESFQSVIDHLSGKDRA